MLVYILSCDQLDAAIALTFDYFPNTFMTRDISQHRCVAADAVKIRVTYPRKFKLDEDFAFSWSWHWAVALDPHLCGDRSTCGSDNSSDLNWRDWRERHVGWFYEYSRSRLGETL